MELGRHGDGPEWRRAKQVRWPARVVASAALALLLGLAGCGQETTVAGIRSKPTATATATPAVSPTPIPYPQQWQAASGLPATVTGYAFAQSAPQTGYACTSVPGGGQNGGFWTTQDSGQTWTAVASNNSPIGADGCSVSVDPMNPQDVFAWDSVIMSRSQDGGHTWTQMASLVGQSGPSQWHNITFTGGRLVAVGIPTGSGEGAGNQSDLYASDDGGKTWQSIGQNILAQTLNAGNFVMAGQTLYVSGYPMCAGGPPIDGCQGDALALAGGAFGGATSGAASGNIALDLPLSGDRPVPYRYFASTDGGKTFTEMHVPGAAALSELSFTPNPAGGFYGVVLSTANDLTSTIFWSNNTGSSWQSMPTVDASVPGQPNPTAFGIMGRLAVCPDGSIIAGAWRQRFPQDGAGDLGFYQAPGGIAFAKWQPLAAGGFFQLSAVPQGEDVRVWALRYTGSLWQGAASTQGGDTLESISFQAVS